MQKDLGEGPGEGMCFAGGGAAYLFHGPLISSQNYAGLESWRLCFGFNPLTVFPPPISEVENYSFLMQSCVSDEDAGRLI